MGKETDSIRLDILERTRKYGYLYWRKEQDAEVQDLLGRRKTVDVILDGLYLGKKQVAMGYRRISIGPAKVEVIPDTAKEFELRFDDKGRLEITCR